MLKIIKSLKLRLKIIRAVTITNHEGEEGELYRNRRGEVIFTKRRLATSIICAK
jgi:hypothetical protein